VQYKNILAMIFNENKCDVNISLGLVGGCISCIHPVFAPAYQRLVKYFYFSEQQ